MMDFTVKRRKNLRLSRQRECDMGNPEWVPLMETLFFLREVQQVRFSLYLVNFDLTASDSSITPILQVRATVQNSSGEFPIFSEEYSKPSGSSPPLTVQYEYNTDLSPGSSVIVSQLSIRGDSGGNNYDVELDMKKAYLVVGPSL